MTLKMYFSILAENQLRKNLRKSELCENEMYKLTYDYIFPDRFLGNARNIISRQLDP